MVYYIGIMTDGMKIADNIEALYILMSYLVRCCGNCIVQGLQEGRKHTSMFDCGHMK